MDDTKYVSRRTKRYDNVDSAGEEEEDDDKCSGAIEYKDTLGNLTSLAPN